MSSLIRILLLVRISIRILLLVPLKDLDVGDSMRHQEGHWVIRDLLVQRAGQVQPEGNILGIYLNFSTSQTFVIGGTLFLCGKSLEYRLGSQELKCSTHYK